MKGDWLNTTKVINPDIEKPCVKLRYCPYGQLVEEYPLYTTPEQSKEWDAPEYPNLQYGDKLSCSNKNNGNLMQFGHDCPVHYRPVGKSRKSRTTRRR
jgi:hypothetical protein